MPGSIVGGIFGNKAAKTQAKSADEAGDVQLQMFRESAELSEPWRTSGEGALSALSYELGLGGTERPMIGQDTRFNVGDRNFDTRFGVDEFISSLPEHRGGEAGHVPHDEMITETKSGGNQYLGFQETPGYQFQLDEGQKAINRSLAARGKLLSGPAVKEGLRFSQGLADQTYSSHLSRLANLAGLGSASAGQTGALGVQTGQGVANSLIQGGNARASGYAATGQAIGGSINSIFGGLGSLSSGGSSLSGFFG